MLEKQGVWYQVPAFFYPDRRGGFVACHRLQVSSLVSASGNFGPSRAIS